jgi:hypothetical protein
MFIVQNVYCGEHSLITEFKKMRDEVGRFEARLNEITDSFDEDEDNE